MSETPEAQYCECPSPRDDTQLFRWRGDPEWWSCTSCDGRVRLITDEEKRELESRSR